MRTTCERCGKPIPEPRRNKKFCGKTCRAENCHEKKGTRARSRATQGKPLQSAAKDRRRQTKDGHGTRLYVVRDELELVRDVLAGKRPRANAARDRLLEKIPRALKQLDRKAA